MLFFVLLRFSENQENVINLLNPYLVCVIKFCVTRIASFIAHCKVIGVIFVLFNYYELFSLVVVCLLCTFVCESLISKDIIFQFNSQKYAFILSLARTACGVLVKVHLIVVKIDELCLLCNVTTACRNRPDSGSHQALVLLVKAVHTSNR